LSNNQWEIGAELGNGDWTQSSFYLALRSPSCKGTCMVLDADALPLTRSWCLFEVVQTYRLTQEELGSIFHGLSYCTNRGVIGQISENECFDISIALANRLAQLDLRNASASSKEDEAMIKDLVVKEGGFNTMNTFIKRNMGKTLALVQKQFLDKVHLLEGNLGGSDDTAKEMEEEELSFTPEVNFESPPVKDLRVNIDEQLTPVMPVAVLPGSVG